MASPKGFTVVGYMREKFPVVAKQINGKSFYKRTFIIRRAFRKKGRWLIDDILFILTNDACDKIDTILPGEEVTVRFDISARLWINNGDIKRRDNGEPIVFQELRAWDVFTTGRPNAKNNIWNLTNFQSVKNDHPSETGDTLMDEDRKTRFPNDRHYTPDNFSLRDDLSKKEEEDDLPF